MVCTSSVVGSIDRSDLRRRNFNSGLMVLACSVVALLTGCGIGNVDHSLSPDPVQGAVLQGRVHGGNQPVTGSTIQLYEIEATAGETGYPGDVGATAPRPLLTGNITDTAGNFAITGDYTCDNLTDDVYITATQGNPGLGDGGSNPNLALMAALGPCNGLKPTTFINIDEVTTIASVYALAQFAGVNSSGGGITISNSGSTSAIAGLANAFATVNNLVDISTGQALTETPAYKQSGDVPYFNSSTVPQARINTLSNILANCVNSNGSTDTGAACNLLFAAAKPNGGTAPVDTLQAALDIALNPGNNVAALYALSTANAPFQPTLGLPSPGPNDWTIALTFTGAGLGFAPGSGYQLVNTSLDVDDSGNIWTTAYGSTSDGGISSMIAEFNSLGAPLTPVSSEVIPTGGGTPDISYGGYHPYDSVTGQGVGVDGPFSAVIDPSENVWVGDAVGRVSVVSPNLTLAFADPPHIGSIVPEGASPYIAFDGTGDAWIAGEKAVGEYNTGGGLISPAAGWTGGGTYGNNYYGAPAAPTFDSAGNLWVTDISFGSFYRISATPGSTNGQLAHDYYTSGNGPKNTPIVADGSGNIFTCNVAHNGFTVYNAASNNPGNSFTGGSGSGTRCASVEAIDGLGHLWAAAGSVLDEYTTSGTVLSPASTGFTATSSGELPTQNGSNAGMAVDGSGNLWVLNSGTAMNSGNALVEFVGLAAPVVTPHSLALQQVELATRP